MRKFRSIISVLFLVLVVAIIGNIVLSTLGLFFDYHVTYVGNYSSEDISLSIKLIFIFKAIALLVFTIGVFILIRKTNFLVQQDFFNPRLIDGFAKSGKLFLFSGSLGFLTSIASVINITILNDFSNQFYLNIDSKSLYIILMILGLLFLLFSKVLSRGNQIQQENDLTI